MIWKPINYGRSWEAGNYKIHSCVRGFEVWQQSPFICLNREVPTLTAAKHLAEMMADNVAKEQSCAN